MFFVMKQLPLELLHHICSFAQRSTLRALRLTCRAFAEIGEEHLFREFEFRLYPDPHRLYLLEQLATRSSIASNLKCVSFESGVQLEYADFRYWQAQVYAEKHAEWARSTTRREEDYAPFHEALQARFTPDMPRIYELYRWHLDQQAASMAEPGVWQSLTRALSALSDIRPDLRLKIVMAEPQIELSDLESFDPAQYASDRPTDPDPRRRISNRRKNCLAHFGLFLGAALRSNYDFQNLTALDIPSEFLKMDNNGEAGTLDVFFARLQKLRFNISQLPHSDWLSRTAVPNMYLFGRNMAARRMKELLNKSTRLEELALQFHEDKRAEFSFEIFDRTNLDMFPRLWVPHLKKLELCQFLCSWGDLRTLLDEGKSLTYASLRDCRLERGSLVWMLQYLAERRLPQVRILGSWVVDEDGGTWHSHSGEDYTYCAAATSFEGPYISNGLQSKINEYIHHGGNCPLPAWPAIENPAPIWESLGDTSFHFIENRIQ